jgi:uncharacterized protein with PhoU and TrkA domain
MFDQNMADKVHSGFDLKATLSTTALAAPTFAAAAVVGNVVATTVLDDELLLTVAWTLTQDDRFTGKSVGEVMEHHSVVVLRVSSAERGARLFPPPSEVLRLGDALVVQGRYDDLVGLAMTVG